MRLCEIKAIIENIKTPDCSAFFISLGEAVIETIYNIVGNEIISYEKRTYTYNEYIEYLKNEFINKLWAPDPLDTESILIFIEEDPCKFKLIENCSLPETPKSAQKIIEKITKIIGTQRSEYD
ncbi:MAG: hypothetical protein DRN04_14420 [Thermoprotei archaeon]|nr:MAG: hypothetical protein DRN04_14420 [Thermoprotei archaeon]